MFDNTILKKKILDQYAQTSTLTLWSKRNEISIDKYLIIAKINKPIGILKIDKKCLFRYVTRSCNCLFALSCFFAYVEWWIFVFKQFEKIQNILQLSLKQIYSKTMGKEYSKYREIVIMLLSWQNNCLI